MALFDERPSMDELKEVARGLASGHVFTDLHLRNPETEMSMVFMPIGLGVLSGITEEECKQIGMIYEWLDKAGPRSCNGLPMFMSVNILHRDDARTVLEMCNKLKEASEQVLNQVANSR